MPGRQHAAHLLRHLLVGLAVRVVDGRDDQVLQHLDVVLRDDLGIDLERLQLLRAVDDDGDHAAAGGGLDAQLGHLLLQALLHLLRLLHHLLNLLRVHISSTSRISAGKHFEQRLHAGVGERLLLERRLPVGVGRRASRPPPAGAALLRRSMSDTTAIFRPASLVAIASSAGRYLSNVGPIFCAAANVSTMRSADDVDPLRLRDERVVQHRLRSCESRRGTRP